MKNKGQALAEFILLLPVLMLLVLGMIDFGNIIYQKYKLENDLDTVVNLYQNEQLDTMRSYLQTEGITASIDKEEGAATILVSKQVRVYTPGLNRIFENPYSLKTKRVIYHES